MNDSLLETSIAQLLAGYVDGRLTCLEVTDWYLERIHALDIEGPGLNSVIAVAPDARERAARLDAALAEGGPIGPLHGVPVLIKDQLDVAGMATTLGSTLFRDYFPDRDGTVTEQLKAAGAVILAKTTLGELGGGDTHGTLFGSTRNPFDLERTPGGSSGGSATAVSANLGAVAIGQEGLASIRRPSAWTSIVGMRPSLGLVSRAGAYSGWPGRSGSLGPMTRTVEDLARLMDVIVGLDPEDPTTALGHGKVAGGFTAQLDAGALDGARIGVVRESMGLGAEPGSEDFARVAGVFGSAVEELGAAGAMVVDDVVIPDLKALLAKRAFVDVPESFSVWMGRSANPPYRSLDELTAQPLYGEVMRRRSGGRPQEFSGTAAEYAEARLRLLTNLHLVMAEADLDALVHVTVEHSPTLIRDGVNPPYVNQKGAPHLNTFLNDVPSITVPAGFTSENLPVGMTFVGRPFSDQLMVRLAYAYEQATQHRRAPELEVAAAGALSRQAG